jgi:hypothetical protein
VAPRKQRNNGKRYSDTEKMVACQIVRANGGKLTNELLSQIQTAINIPALSWDTVQRWWNTEVEGPKTQTATNDSRVNSAQTVESSQLDFKKAATREIIEHTFRQYAKRANNTTTVETTEGKDAARVMTDMLKLMQLVDGLPTEIIGAASELTELANFLREEGLELSPAIRQWREQLQAKRDAKATTKVKQEAISNA